MQLPDGFSTLETIHRKNGRALFRAIHEDSQTPVWIRSVPASGHDPAGHEKLQTDFRKLAALSPKRFTRLFHLGIEASPPRTILSIIYEKASEAPLASHMQDSRFPPDVFLNLAVQMAEAVQQVHQAGLFFRSLSPAVILFDPDTRRVRIETTALLFRNLFPMTGIQPEDGQQAGHDPLPYISPEQTGRMNAPADYRSDFYSLGVLFYELITGRRPFEQERPLEIIHAHLAYNPTPPVKIRTDIPEPISRIILKLLSKIPEDRYQSTFGLLADLRQCRRHLREKGRIPPFPIGNQDRPEQVRISPELFGRDDDINQIMAVWDRVRSGSAELLLISGFPGIGKSRLVSELSRPIAESGGFFGCGKYDPFHKNMPYSAIIQAFQDLIRQILAGGSAQIETWKKRIRDALGDQGQLIARVIPEIEWIIGPQQPAPVLSPPDAQNRFHQIFSQFIQVFAQPEHPLVFFIDDIHWIDSASLALIERFFTATTVHHCLFIGALRPQEGHRNQALAQTFERIRSRYFPITTLTLKGLAQEHVDQFISASLSRNIEKIDRFSQIICQNTGGNPLSIGRLLFSLASRNLLHFDHESGIWRWDPDALASEAITQNVVEMMLDEIRKLPPAIQDMMKQAACIGLRFDFRILATVSEMPTANTANLLSKAIQAGYIIARGDSNRFLSRIITTFQTDPPEKPCLPGADKPFLFEFLHDRVRQAVYSLVPIEKRKTAHFRIGRLMWKQMKTGAFTHNIFSLVNQLNYGVDMIGTLAERIDLARLNLDAGRQAKDTTAYALSLSYLITGVSLLPQSAWTDHYPLAKDLYFEKMECEYLNQNFSAADRTFEQILTHIDDDLDKARAYNLKMVMFAGQARHQEAVTIGLTGLRCLGVGIPEPRGYSSILLPLAKAALRFRKKAIPYLAGLPRVNDPRQEQILRMLMNISFSAYLCNPFLIVIVALQIMQRTLRHGNTDASATGYVIYGSVLCGIFGRYGIGNCFGDLCLTIQKRFGRLQTDPKILLYYGMGICPWKHPLGQAIGHNRNGLQSAIETGDQNYAVYHIQSILISLFVQGVSLSEIDVECNNFRDYIAHTRDSAALNYLVSLQQTIKCLQGRTRAATLLDDDDFEEAGHVAAINREDVPIILLRHYLLKMRLLYIMGDADAARHFSRLCRPLLQYHIGTILIPEYAFFHGLILLAAMRSTGYRRKPSRWFAVYRNLRMLRRMARSCPENFEHKYLLLKAETASVRGTPHMAATYFEQAIESATASGFQHIAALANERAARHFTAIGQPGVAQTFFSEAITAYRQWGADAKVDQLLGEIRSAGTDAAALPNRHRRPGRIDYAAVLHSLQTISTEIVLENLLKKLMRIVLQNAGARKGFFLVQTDSGLHVKAVAHTGEPIRVTLHDSPVEQWKDLLLPAVNTVRRTRKYLSLDDAFRKGDYVSDPYMKLARPKSILCLPILHQAELAAVLYLENDIAVGAFTPDRVEILQLIASQAAISLENARLYDRMLQKERDLSRLSEKLRSLSSELLLTEERERRRIAVELHDRIGHALAHVKIQLRMLQEVEQPEKKQSILQSIHQQIDTSIQDTHSLTFELSPPVLYDLGLDAAMEWLAYQMNQQHGIRITYEGHPITGKLGEDYKVLIFQAARELLFNVIKHAQAREVRIRTRLKDGRLFITIQDDGIGFTQSEAGYTRQNSGGFGLFSIQERLKHQGGDLTIDSRPGKGANITMVLPVADNHPKNQ